MALAQRVEPLTLTGLQIFLLVAAGLGAGIVNGAAGGGTLVSFPALLVVGYPALIANVTSTVGIWSGYLGGTAGFRVEVLAQRATLRALAFTVVAGAATGGVLLLTTPSHYFSELAPYLLLFSCGLFAVQPVVTKRLRSRPESSRNAHHLGLHSGTFLAAVYGAYFGAGLGVVLLAVLSFTIDDSLNRINGLRSVLALTVNTVAVLIFVIHAQVAWRAAGLMAVSSLVGGYVGARAARRVPPVVLRTIILGLGLAAATRLLVG
jgi:uncharacterized membrane protein YfcA